MKMKKIILIILSILFLNIEAQVPQGFSYQAIAYNPSGSPIVNSNISIRIKIVDNSVNGTNLYTEVHSKTTNSNGLYSLVIGQGAPVNGSFSSINWALNVKYLTVEIDPNGGNNYTLVGSNQLMSVPYAFHSNTSNAISTSSGSNANTLIYLSNGF